MAAVSVVEDASGIARLRINNRQQEGSSATLRFDGRQAWLPLLLHPGPTKALFLGLGTGVTATAAAADETLDVDAVELLPEVIEASSHFTGTDPMVAARSRLHVLAADARRFVRTTQNTYDVVVSDNFHPARSGSGALYTVEHFEAVRSRLNPRGLFCQWLPLHQLDLETLRSIVRSYLVAFPRAWAILASNSLETPVIGLVARHGADTFDATAVASRVAGWPPEQRARFGLEDALAVMGGFIAGPDALARLATGAPLNTDDRPIVAYAGPRATYRPEAAPRDRLFTLLGQVSIVPAALLSPAGDSAFSERLAAYWRARDRFIESGRDVRATADVRAMLVQVRDPLLAVLRISGDFRPAYDPLLAMAGALASSDADDARRLLAELATLQPAREEAPRALARLRSDVGDTAPLR